MSRSLPALGLALVLLGGCLPLDLFKDGQALDQVPSDPFPAQVGATRRAKVSYAPAAQDAAMRVDAAGRKLIAANEALGVQPLFATIGATDPEVFHLDTSMVYVTEGLVRQCRSDADLSAVLALELGRMVAEREGNTRREVRDPEPQPPVSLPIGSRGNDQASDPVHIVEQAKFEKQRPRTARKLARPDPEAVARTVLEQAGFQKTDFDEARPILQEAEKHSGLERQFKGIVGR